jgi:hypothetical protein
MVKGLGIKVWFGFWILDFGFLDFWIGDKVVR